VIVGDKTMVMKTPAGKFAGFLTVGAFELWHGNRYVTYNDKKKPLGRYWLEHPQRRQYKGLTFSPGKEVPGHFNLWQGFTVKPKPGDCSKFLAHIHDDSLHLLALIDDLLDLSKIEAGRLELHCESIHLGSVIQDAISFAEPLAAEARVQLSGDTSQAFVVDADRIRLRQILHNLLTNAIKFTPAHGHVTVAAATSGRFAEISVSDTGIGIPEDQHQAVFDKFYQLRTAQRGKPAGTGLGLAITKRLVEQHGGTIRLESQPGAGSRFTFTIPLEQAL